MLPSHNFSIFNLEFNFTLTPIICSILTKTLFGETAWYIHDGTSWEVKGGSLGLDIEHFIFHLDFGSIIYNAGY